MEFKNKNGDVSPYGFLCGHIQRHGDFLGGEYVDIVPDSACYHVQAQQGNGERMWESFSKLSRARRYFNRLRTALKRGKNIHKVYVDPTKCTKCGETFDMFENSHSIYYCGACR